MLLIPFLVSFVDDPDPANPSERQVNKDLMQELENEYSQILYWMAEGARRYHEEGLVVPESIRRSTEEYRQEMDTISMFLEECCDLFEDSSCGAQILYEAYKRWSERYGHRPLGIKKFSPTMQKRFSHKRASGGFQFQGININHEWKERLDRYEYS